MVVDILESLDLINSEETSGLSFGTILAFGALIGMPIIGAVVGFLTGIVEAFLYNSFTQWFGGLHIHFE
jgi:hypothetical protein